ncbi:MAG: DUF6703 family protein [Candidatus Nanopelagicales bacterium]
MAKPNKGRAASAGRSHASPASARPQTAIQRWSAPVLLRLHGLPRWLFPLFTALLLVGGLVVGNAVIAAVLLSLLTLLLLWLVALSWPLLSPMARFMRLAVLVGLLLVTVNRARGRM